MTGRDEVGGLKVAEGVITDWSVDVVVSDATGIRFHGKRFG